MLIIIFLAFKIIDFFVNYFYLNKVYNVLGLLSARFGYLILISGGIRKGKTSLMCGLSHMLVFLLQNELSQKIQEIQIKVNSINYNLLNAMFINYCDEAKTTYHSLDDDVDKFLDKLAAGLSESIYSDGISKKSYYYLIKEYLTCLWHLRRGILCYSNVKIYNHVTGRYSEYFESDSMRLKRWEGLKKPFNLSEFSVVMYDESLLDNSNVNAIKKLNEDSGSDIFFRLYGQLFREHSYFLTTAQKASRLFKSDRELFTTFIDVKGCRVVYNQPSLMKLLGFFQALNDFNFKIFSLFLRIFKSETRYSNKNNLFKKIDRFLLRKREKITASSFLRYDVAVYYDSDDVGKVVDLMDSEKESFVASLLLPLRYCYGVYDTFYFHKVLTYIVENSREVERKGLDFEAIEQLLRGNSIV